MCVSVKAVERMPFEKKKKKRNVFRFFLCNPFVVLFFSQNVIYRFRLIQSNLFVFVLHFSGRDMLFLKMSFKTIPPMEYAVWTEFAFSSNYFWIRRWKESRLYDINVSRFTTNYFASTITCNAKWVLFVLVFFFVCVHYFLMQMLRRKKMRR